MKLILQKTVKKCIYDRVHALKMYSKLSGLEILQDFIHYLIDIDQVDELIEMAVEAGEHEKASKIRRMKDNIN